MQKPRTPHSLLTGSAGIHVYFHSDRHFDNLRSFPGHTFSPCERLSFAAKLLPNRTKCQHEIASVSMFRNAEWGHPKSDWSNIIFLEAPRSPSTAIRVGLAFCRSLRSTPNSGHAAPRQKVQRCAKSKMALPQDTNDSMCLLQSGRFH